MISSTGSTHLEVVIVSYRCEALLRDCLQALIHHPALTGMQVRVVDNASHDGTAEMVAREFPQVELTVNKTNLGFSAANNIGIRAGTTPYVLALNPDTQVTEGALDRMLELMESQPGVAVSGPRLLLKDGEFDHAAKRSFPTPVSALGHFTGIARHPRAPGELGAYRAPEVKAGPVDAVNGAFMLMRREALSQVGLFDEGFWMYMEDLDLCYRLREAGWVTWYEPSATVIHVKAGTTGPRRSLRLNRAFHYGMHRFYSKHYAADRSAPVNLAVYIGIWLKFGISATRGGLARVGLRVAGLRARRS